MKEVKILAEAFATKFNFHYASSGNLVFKPYHFYVTKAKNTKKCGKVEI